MKYIVLLYLCLVGYLSYSQVTVKIDVLANRQEISPYIYGLNGSADSTFASVRLGGNRMTGYNWENNFSNAGVDMQNVSDDYLVQNIDYSMRNIPGIALLNYQKKALLNNQFSIVTIPLAGFVSADGKGSVVLSDKSTSATWYKRWCKVIAKKQQALSLTPNISDSLVYLDEEINYLTQKAGDRIHGGISAFSLDNEPDFWSTKHPRIHPTRMRLSELYFKTIDASANIRKYAPQSEIFGPALANISGLETGGSATDYQLASPQLYPDFTSNYLDSLRRYDKRNGTKSLDVFDYHWYPEGIVDLSSNPDPTDSLAIVQRLQIPRVMWDSTYKDSKFSFGNYIPFFRDRISKNYPGIKIAFTEFLCGAEDHFSGGLALADILGVFGREGVYLATKWYAKGETPFYRYGEAAYKLYRNYDGKFSRFGSLSVSTINRSIDTLSVYSSIDGQQRLHCVLINKKPFEVTVTCPISNGYFKSKGCVWGFDNTTSNLVQRDSVLFNGTNFIIKLAPYSASHVVFESLVRLKIDSAFVSVDNPRKILLSYSGPISLNLTKGIIVRNGVDVLNIDSVRIEYNNSLAIYLHNNISNQTQLTVDLTSGLVDKNGTPVEELMSFPVKNPLYNAGVYLFSANVSSNGFVVTLKFNKLLNSITSKLSDILVLKNNKIITPSKIFYEANGVVRIVFINRFNKYDSVFVSLSRGTCVGIDGSVNQDIISFRVMNLAPNFAPDIVAVNIINEGLTLAIEFSTSIKNNSVINGFTLKVNNSEYAIKGVVRQDKFLKFELPRKIDYSDAVYLSYDTLTKVETVLGGYLDPFLNYSVANVLTLKNTITLPGLIESEDYWYKRDSVGVRGCNDIGGGNELFFEASPNEFGYKILVLDSLDYTLNLRYSTAYTGLIKVLIDGVLIDTITYNSSNNSWNYLSSKLNLSKGNHTLGFVLLTGRLSLNHMKISVAKNVSILQKNITRKSGRISLVFSHNFKTLPSNTAFTVFSNSGNQYNITSVIQGINSNEIILITSSSFDNQTVNLQINGSLLSFDNGKYVDSSIVFTSSVDLSIEEMGFSYKNNELTICFNQLYEVDLFDMLGHKVWSISNSIEEHYMLNLNSGVYIAQVKVGDAVVTKKIVVN